jgi:hypothetical protein
MGFFSSILKNVDKVIEPAAPSVTYGSDEKDTRTQIDPRFLESEEYKKLTEPEPMQGGIAGLLARVIQGQNVAQPQPNTTPTLNLGGFGGSLLGRIFSQNPQLIKQLGVQDPYSSSQFQFTTPDSAFGRRLEDAYLSWAKNQSFDRPSFEDVIGRTQYQRNVYDPYNISNIDVLGNMKS